MTKSPMKKRGQGKLGGFCETCGGTGRSESGCSPCSDCNLYKQPFKLGNLQKLLGLPQDEEPPTHKHKCGKCGFIWEHETDDCMNNTPAHTCRECGTEQWFWYEGETQGNVPFL